MAGQRAAAAPELEALATLEPLPRRHHDRADPASAPDVSPATGRQIESLDVDQPERPAARRLLAQGQPRRFLRVREADGHRPILPNDAVRFGLRGGDLRRRHLAREVDRRHFPAEVKADGADAEQLVEGGRENVLAGVLLHVVEPALPVDGAMHHLSGFGVQGSGFDHMRDRSVLFVDDIDDAQRGEAAGVEGLAAGGGIERGAVERDEQAVVAAIDAHDRRVKLPEIRVVVVEAVGHRVSTIPFSWTGWRYGRQARSRAARRRRSRRPIHWRDDRWCPRTIR